MKKNKITIEKLIKEFRLELGLNQQEFAKELGINRSLICYYESGKRQPRACTVRKIVDYVNAKGKRDIKYRDLLETG